MTCKCKLQLFMLGVKSTLQTCKHVNVIPTLMLLPFMKVVYKKIFHAKEKESRKLAAQAEGKSLLY